MDLSGVRNLQFLDLSEVDEVEKTIVLSSLHLDKPDNKFPWFIGDEKSTFKRSAPKVVKHKLPQNPTVEHGGTSTAPTVSQLTGPPLQQTFSNRQYYPEPVNYPIPAYQSPQSNSKSIPIIDPNTGEQVIYNNNFITTQQNSPVYYPPGTVAVPLITTNVYPTYYPNVPQYTFPQGVAQYSTGASNVYIANKPLNGAGIHPENTAYTTVLYNNSGWVSTGNPVSSTTNAPEWSQNSSVNYGASENVTEVHNTLAEAEPVWEKSTDVPVENNAAKHPGTYVNGTAEPPVVESAQVECKTYENPVVNNPPTTFTQANDVNNSTKTVSAAPVTKSWAGLFSAKKDKNDNGQVVNGTVKPAFNNEAVNKESNHNVNGTVCPIKNPKKAQFVDPDCYRMGEFLTTFALDGRTISLQPRGLINQSNYCYINSILQALIACPPVYNLLNGLSQNISSNEKRKPTPVIDGMCRFIKEFKHLPANMRVSRRSDPKGQKKDQTIHINTDIPFEPSWIYRMLNGIRTDLIQGRQEDAEEFLGCLLNNLNDEMLELIKLVKNEDTEEEIIGNVSQHNHIDSDSEEKGWQVMGPKNKGSVTRRTEFERTPISDIFGGFLKSRIHRTGDHITENIQPFFTLQLNIEKVKSVKEALEALTTKNQLEGVTSSKTNEEVEAWQQVTLDELPVILVLHLKCFDFQLDGCTKIIKAVEFPVDLKIDPKLLSTSSKSVNPKEKQYKLFAVVYHDGKEASKGHYLTDAFHVGYSSWLRYDDASVKPVQEDHVLKPLGTRVPYLLFYRRSDTIRSK